MQLSELSPLVGNRAVSSLHRDEVLAEPDAISIRYGIRTIWRHVPTGPFDHTIVVLLNLVALDIKDRLICNSWESGECAFKLKAFAKHVGCSLIVLLKKLLHGPAFLGEDVPEV